jgi:hypothetical protein
MQEFASRQNIERFEHLLKTGSDPVKRKVLLDLLAAEKFKLAALRLAR